MSLFNDPPPLSPRHTPPEPADGWQATRAQTALATQMLQDDTDVPQVHPDVGRPVGAGRHELFVSCAPDEALEQQFDHLRPEYMVVHDVGTASSRKLLLGIASASGRALQTLAIRRQGFGTTLATLEFLELPTCDGNSLRLYTTAWAGAPSVPTEAGTHEAVALMLLRHSRLGVIMVGELAAPALAAALKPLREQMAGSGWRNRHLLLLPLSSAHVLVTQGVELSNGTGVNVRTTPQVTRPADAWSFIAGTWSRLREQGKAVGLEIPELASLRPTAGATPTAAPPPSPSPAPAFSQAATEPMPMLPMPEIPRGPSAASSPVDPLQRYVQQVSELPGIVSCCVFDMATGRDLHHAGASPRPAELARHGGALLDAMSATSRALGLGHAVPEAAITLGSHHLLLRPVPGHPGLVLHAALDKAQANLVLARLQLQRLDELLEPPR